MITHNTDATHVFGQDLGSSREPGATAMVFVVDEDPTMRDSLVQLIRSQGWQPHLVKMGEKLRLTGAAPEDSAHARRRSCDAQLCC